VDRRDWDAIVIGLGGIGSGAAYWLSRSLGPGVLGLEQFELGHDRGASSDHSRIIRLSYHRPDYVRLARRAYETWEVVEREAGERIVTITGGLDLWPADAAIAQSDYTASLPPRRAVRVARRARRSGGAGPSGGSVTR
jgi:sarcosine oxidase